MSAHTLPDHEHRFSVLAARPCPRLRSDFRFTAQGPRELAEDMAKCLSKMGFRAVLMRDDGVVAEVIPPKVPREPR